MGKVRSRSKRVEAGTPSPRHPKAQPPAPVFGVFPPTFLTIHLKSLYCVRVLLCSSYGAAHFERYALDKHIDGCGIPCPPATVRAGLKRTRIDGGEQWGENRGGSSGCKYSMFNGLYSVPTCYYSIYIFVPNDSSWFPAVVIQPSNHILDI